MSIYHVKNPGHQLVAHDLLFGGEYFHVDINFTMLKFKAYGELGEDKGDRFLSLQWLLNNVYLSIQEDDRDTDPEREFIRRLSQNEQSSALDFEPPVIQRQDSDSSEDIQGQIFAQNAHQSGDTYGVCMALLLDPTSTLLFITSPKDDGCMEKIEYYAGSGIAKNRINLLMMIGGSVLGGKTDVNPRLGEIATIHYSDCQTLDRDYLPNQVYQQMVNYGVFKTGWERIQKWYLDAGLQFDIDKRTVINDKTSQQEVKLSATATKVREVGATTRCVADLLKGKVGLTKTLGNIWQTFDKNLQSSGITLQTESATDEVVNGITKCRPKGVILIWVRSLNGSEVAGLKTVLKGSALTAFCKRRDKLALVDDFFWLLDSGKRNPHHLMTPQLYETIACIAKRCGYMIIPIGDNVTYDQYASLNSLDSTQYLQSSDDSCNLIGFWRKWDRVFAGNRRRLLQTFFMGRLFQKLAKVKIPMTQVGVRSGEMEKGAYLGIPTVYLEEAVSESGGRMLPVTVGGYQNQSNDASPLAWWADANQFSVGKSAKSVTQQIKSDISSSKKTLSTLQKSDPSSTGIQYHQSNIKRLEAQQKKVLDELDKLRQNRKDLKTIQLHNMLESVTNQSSVFNQLGTGGLPMFFRLHTTHPVGLYAAKDNTQLQQFMAWLNAVMADSPKVECPAAIRHGSLTELEMDLLYNLFLSIEQNFAQYLADMFPSTFLDD